MAICPQDRNEDPGLNLPDIDMSFDKNAATALSQLSKTTRHVTRQKRLAHWMQHINPLLKPVIQADDSPQARMTRLSQCEIKGPHAKFDLPAEKCVRFRPTVFLGNIYLGHYQG